MADSTSSTTSATSSLISSLGAGSGIDFASLATNLSKAQFAAKTDQLTAKSETLTTRISTASNIKSMLLALDTSFATLVRSGNLARTPTVASSSIATASLTGTSPTSGTYSLEVTQLASAQRLASSAYTASSDTVGSGTLTLRFGTVSGTSFTEDTSHSSVDITIESGATLAEVASAINAAGAGVTAYVATTVDGAQLVLRGEEGAANGFILEASEDSSDPGLSDLAWTPSSGSGTLLAQAKDAAFKVDGLAMTSSSNTVSEAIPGLKLVLTGTNSGSATTVSFNDPTDSISSAMQDFTDALNELMEALNTATAIGGDLVSDSGTRALKRKLAQLAGTTVMPNATGNAKTLADLGLSTQRDGTFVFDTERFTATMESDPDGVVAMFTNGLYGVYATFDKIYRNAVSTTDPGSLGSSITRYNSQLTETTDDLSEIAEKQEELRVRFVARFAVSESRITSSQSTLTFIQNQIAAWNSSSD